MKTKIIGLFIFMLFITTALLPIAGTVKIELNVNSEVTIEKTKMSYQDFVTGEFFVKFKEGTEFSPSFVDDIMTTSISSIDNLNKNYKIRDIEETILSVNKKPKNPGLFESIGLDRIYTFKCDKDVDIYSAVESYNDDSHVEFAEPIYIGHGCLIPNDPSFNNQWGLHNTGQTGGTPDADIDAPEGWDVNLGSNNVVIAIVDTGIDYNHVDLDSHIWQNPGEIAGNGIDDDGNGFIDDIRGWDFRNGDNNPMDDHNHGTHCAGIAGAETNNNVGIAGVMWMCKLMAVKSGSSLNKFNENHAANGIVYAADNGADIISMSWSFDWNPSVIENACAYAYASGCFLVASMGNHGSNSLRWPAAYSTVMAVGATDHDDNRCSWSAYGSHINVVAPGLDIYSTIRNNQYEYFWGTSMSTPHVAGLAGLLKAQNPARSNSDIWTIIVNTADDLGSPGWDQYYGMGRINMYTALYGAPYKPILDGPNNGRAGETYTYTAITWDPNGDNIFYWFDWGDSTNSGWVGPYSSGQTGSSSHSWDEQGTFQIKVKAKDTNGKESDWSDTLSVSMPKNKVLNIKLDLSEKFAGLYQWKFSIIENLLGF